MQMQATGKLISPEAYPHGADPDAAADSAGRQSSCCGGGVPENVYNLSTSPRPAAGGAGSGTNGPHGVDGSTGAPPDEMFISNVGELPKIEKNRPGKSSADDETGSQLSDSVKSDAMSSAVNAVTAKDQKKEAKALVKDFVKRMIKGEQMSVMIASGSLKTCTVSLTRKLDVLRIKTEKNKRDIKLVDVDEINVGTDVPEGVTTPVDELCATLMLASGDCITFRFGDLNARDVFVMCLLMFCNGGQEG